MMHGKSGKGLCPISFGVAVGITCAIAMFLWSVWIMYYGVPPMLEIRYMGEMTWGVALVHTLFALIKGFLFGLVIALIYDCCICCFKSSKCGSHCGCQCCGCKGCGCKCCDESTKTEDVARRM